MRQPKLAWLLLLVGVALCFVDGGAASPLGSAAATLCVQHVQAPDRAAQAKAAAAIYTDAAARVADGTYPSAVEVQAYTLDRVQRELKGTGWTDWQNALRSEVRRRIGSSPDPAKLRESLLDVAAGLGQVQ